MADARPAPWQQWGDDIDAASVEQMTQRVRAADRRSRRPHARCPPRLRPAHRRRARHPERGHSLRRRRRHRLPDEAVGLGHAPGGAGRPRRVPGQSHRGRNPVRDRRRLRTAPPAPGHGRGLADHRGHPSMQGQGLVAARHQRQRQPLRRVRRARARPPPNSVSIRAATSPCSATAAAAASAIWWPATTASSPKSSTPSSPDHQQHLAWLDLDERGRPGVLAGHGAHGALRRRQSRVDPHDMLAAALGVEVIAGVENHHNFAWLEEHDGERLVVHRKGATPAGEGVLGIIPGSMATSAFVVRGTGNEASLRSASHGAGRRMSRKQAKKTIHLGRCQEPPAGQRRPAALGRSRRGPDGLQGHRRGHGGPEGPGQAHRAIPAATRQDGPRWRTAGRLMRNFEFFVLNLE